LVAGDELVALTAVAEGADVEFVQAGPMMEAIGALLLVLGGIMIGYGFGSRR
jgi:hypothetical protein